MKKIQFLFKWVDLDDDQKKDLLIGMCESIPLPMPSFDRINEVFSRIDCEFVLYIERGTPMLRLSDITRATLDYVYN